VLTISIHCTNLSIELHSTVSWVCITLYDQLQCWSQL